MISLKLPNTLSKTMIVVILGFVIASQSWAIQFVGNYSTHFVQDNTIFFFCGATVVSIQVCSADIVKVRLDLTGNLQPDTSLVVVHETWPLVNFTVTDVGQTITIETTQIIIKCLKQPFRMAFYDKAERLIVKEPVSGGGLAWEGNYRYAFFEQTANDHFYGFGERSIPLDRKGFAFEMYNKFRGGYWQDEPTMSISIPLFCCSSGYGLYIDNTYLGFVDLRNADQFFYRADGGDMIYYFIYGPSLKEILTKYTWLTGRQPMPPRWALGYLQSKYGYHDENEARSIVTTMREKGIPCDAIILDLYWYGNANLMGNLTWAYSQWPDPPKMIADFKDVGIKTILIEEPYITQQSINFQDAVNNGYFGKDAAGTPMVFQHWSGNAGLIDMTNPSAQAWWWDKHKPLLDQGVAGWWTDLAEPEIYPPDMFFDLGPMIKVHNIYNLLYSKLLYEGYQSYRPNERLFNLTRSGFAGMQRYSTFPWSGDVSKSFDGLKAQLPILLGMGLSGVGYQGSDIGGFTGPPTTPELYARWMQFGAFSPITRAHGAQFPTEPWAFGSEVEAICTKYIKLRYQLLPYIYTMAYQNHTLGLPLARPLVLEYPNDPQVSNLSAEYLWGDVFLVAPVITEGDQQQTVYLPAGGWINYWTGELNSGNQTIAVAAPLDVLPLFVKNGAIIPMQHVMNYSNEHGLDTLILNIYPAASSAYTLYEDDGETNDYLSNAFSLTEFNCQSFPQEIDVTIGIAAGEYANKPVARIYSVQLQRIGTPPDSVLKNNRRLTSSADSTNFSSANESWWYNENRHLLYVKCKAELNSSHTLRVMGTNLITGVPQSTDRCASFKLYSNYPNPFNAETVIEYQLPQAVTVEINIFNIQGQMVIPLVNDFRPAGSYKITWNGLNEYGLPVAGGIYLYQMKAGNFVTVKKMLLLR